MPSQIFTQAVQAGCILECIESHSLTVVWQLCIHGRSFHVCGFYTPVNVPHTCASSTLLYVPHTCVGCTLLYGPHEFTTYPHTFCISVHICTYTRLSTQSSTHTYLRSTYFYGLYIRVYIHTYLYVLHTCVLPTHTSTFHVSVCVRHTRVVHMK
jgi:hypothetical protein